MTKQQFINSDGNKVELSGKVFTRFKGDSFIVCNDFPVVLRGYHLSNEDHGKEKTLSGYAKFFKNDETKEEWDARMEKPKGYITPSHAGYIAERLILVSEKEHDK